MWSHNSTHSPLFSLLFDSIICLETTVPLNVCVARLATPLDGHFNCCASPVAANVAGQCPPSPTRVAAHTRVHVSRRDRQEEIITVAAAALMAPRQLAIASQPVTPPRSPLY